MNYAYFKSPSGANLYQGYLEAECQRFKWIPKVKVYYDKAGYESPFLHKLLCWLEKGDSLYINHINSLGSKSYDILSILENFNNSGIRFFINRVEVDLSKIFKKIEEMRQYNVEHLKSQLHDSDIVDAVVQQLKNL